MALTQNLSFILWGEDRTASKTMDAAAAKAEQSTQRIGSAFSKVGGVIGGEFGGILSEVGSRFDAMGSKSAKLSTGLMVGGGVATVAGVALLKMGSGYKQATDQLDQASKVAGDSVEGMSGRVEKAVATGQNFGRSAVDTKEALAKMTLATGSTAKALGLMNVVSNLAAQRHISLSDAATMVDRILSGSGSKTLTQYGIVMGKASDPTKSLAAAQKLVTTEADRLGVAQTKLSQLQEIDHAKKKLTVQDHIALQNAQATVSKATDNLSAAQTKLANTSSTVITKQEAGKAALEQLSKKLDGQASASVNNFGAQVGIMRTKIQDWVDQVSGPVGSVLAGIGPLFTIAGVAVDLYRAKKDAATVAEITSAASATTAAAATDAETAAVVGMTAAMDINPIVLIGGALVGLAAIAGGIALANTKGITAATTDYTQALKSANGEIDLNIAKTATDALLKDGSLKAAQKLGISSSLVVAAATNQRGAQDLLNKQLQAVNASLDDQKSKAIDNAGGINQKKAAGLKMADEQKSTKDAVDKLSASVRGQSEDLKQTKKNLDIASQSLGGYAGAVRGATIGVGVSGRSGVTPKRASGGTTMRPEMALVGENGPELVGLPGGARVFPTGTGPSGGGGSQINITMPPPQGFFIGTVSDLAKAMNTQLIGGLRNGFISKTELRAALGL